jgi:ABC-2 type transport system permease protein
VTRPDSPAVLVAEREIREGLGTKAFWAGLVVSSLIVAAVIVLPSLGRGTSTNTVRFAVIGELGPSKRVQLAQAAAFVGAQVAPSDIASLPAAQAALRKGTLDLAVVNGAELVVRRVPTANDQTPKSRAVGAISIALALERAPLPVSGLDPPRAATSPGDRVTAFFGMVLLYAFLVQYGVWIIASVSTEKTSRVAELLLVTVRPRQLLAGKVLGIGALGLLQVSAVGAVAVTSGFAVGTNVVRDRSLRMVLATVAAFGLGYLLYGFCYAGAAAMVATAEDARSVGVPLHTTLAITYLAASGTAFQGHDSTLLKVLSMVPFTSPMAMPLRIGLRVASLTEVIVAVVLMAIAIAAAARIAGWVYEQTILRTGKRVRARDLFALRRAPA